MATSSIQPRPKTNQISRSSTQLRKQPDEESGSTRKPSHTSRISRLKRKRSSLITDRSEIRKHIQKKRTFSPPLPKRHCGQFVSLPLLSRPTQERSKSDAIHFELEPTLIWAPLLNQFSIRITPGPSQPSRPSLERRLETSGT